MRSGLLKGEWGQGSWYTGPSPLGDSPAVILCLGEPSTSLLLLLPTPSSPSVPTQVTPLSSPPLNLILPLAGLKALISTLTMPKHFHEQGALEDKTSLWIKKKRKKEAPLVSTEQPLLLCTLSRHSPPSTMPAHLPVPPLSQKNKNKTHW